METGGYPGWMTRARPIHKGEEEIEEKIIQHHGVTGHVGADSARFRAIREGGRLFL